MEEQAPITIDTKLDAIYKSVEKTRKMFVTMIWVSILTVVLPLLFIVVALPIIINNYISSFGGLF